MLVGPRIVIALASVAGLLGGVAPARAVEAGEDRELARRHFQTGVEDFDHGDYEAAIHEFQVGMRYARLPEFDYNIARAYDHAGDAARARRYYRQYLSERPATDDRAQIDEAIARLGRRVGTLLVTTVETGSTLQVDGEPARFGERLEVNAGMHTVVVTPDGGAARAFAQRVTPEALATLAVGPIATPGPLAPGSPPQGTTATSGATAASGAGAASGVGAAPSPTAAALGHRRWPLWVGVGVGAAVLVAGALAVALSVSRGTDYAEQASLRCAVPCQVYSFH